MDDQFLFFQKLQSVVYNKILVAKNILKDKQFRPSYRQEIISNEQIIDHHTISSNEIVFDMDFKNYSLNYKHAKLIISTLDERKIPYYVYSSGGKGLHIHIYFDKIEINNEEIRKLFTDALQYGFTWTHLRQFIFNLILEEAGISKNFIGKYIDTKKINFNDLEESNVLIRACGGRNQKIDDVTGNIETSYKTWIPLEEFKDKKIQVKNISQVKYPEEIKAFNINQFELGQCLKDYITEAQTQKKQVLEQVVLPNGYTGLSSVQRILEGLEEGKRNDGAKILALALVLDKYSDEKAYLVMEQYASNCSQIGHQFTKSEALGWYKWMKYQPSHFWNNEHVKKLGVWDKDTDEYYLLHKKDSLKVLGNKTLLKRIDDYLANEIVGEKDNRVLIFLLLLSSKFKVDKEWNIAGDPKPQSVILSSLSASGKSYISKAILKLFGEEGIDFYTFSRMTGAVLNYFTDIDMTSKVLFVEELQGLDKESNQLRLWISEGKLKLATVEKVEDGEETKNRLVIKESQGQPVFITGTAEDTVDEQMNNRSWLISLDISEQQNKAILKYESMQASQKRTSNSDELRILKDAIKELKAYHFIIPFFDYELLNIPTNDVRIRRDFKKFGDLICCITLLFQKQRICVKDDKNREYLISSLEDYELAVKYSERVLSSTFSGLTNQQIILLEQIKTQTWNNEFELADIQRLTNWSQSKCYTMINQLEEIGTLTSSGKRPGVPTVYSYNSKKKLVNLNLPTADQLLEKLVSKNANFIFLQKYDFHYEEGVKTGKISEKIIWSIENQIFSGGISANVADFAVLKSTNNIPPYIETLELSPKNRENLSFVKNPPEKNLIIDSSNSSETSTNNINPTPPNLRKELLEFLESSSLHLHNEFDLETKFGTGIFPIIDSLCIEGIVFKPKQHHIMKL
jgi:hypothetical protein